MAALLSKERTVAATNYNRWLIPPSALATHLCIGQVYALSVFNLPLTRQLGISHSLPEDWKLTQLGWIFTIAIFVLGASAAVFGKWVQEQGPRKSGFVAALCWSLGFLVGALGIHLHQLWLVYLGYGVIGGCGLGIGYITPVSTLIAWFPDRRGMATGMAIMGFGGGALIASPLSDQLMKHFASATSSGIPETWVVLGLLYLAFMMAGAFGYRVPPSNFSPAGWQEPPAKAREMITHSNVTPSEAIHTRQFWLLWVVLCFNVTAGIGVLSQASAMIQEVFKGRITASGAAGFVGLLSLFNLLGRFAWASLSDKIGRKATFACFFTLGPVLYALVPLAGRSGSVALFVSCAVLILSMYGGGFATIPAYLADIFGPKYVSAVHGRLLTAWSAAGVLGPVLVNYIRQFQVEHGVPQYQAYNATMYIMAALLVVAFFANLAVSPVSPEHAERGAPGPRPRTPTPQPAHT
ncbi:MAG TPA: OFA family MFS transporter [Polyangiaceae bacterium]|jgi:MFS family permease|nr:OFA family MFS transporter [Polyangiaceae bacterium]